MDLRDMTLKDYVSKASSKDPVPGGGSVSALVGALGGALSNMVCALTENKKAFLALGAEERESFLNANEEISKLGEKIFEVVQRDAEVFNTLINAMKLPKETDEEKSKRNETLQALYKEALEVPMELAEGTYEILKRLPFLAKLGDKFAVSDAGCGALFAYAAGEAALFNVLINLNYITDLDYKEKMTEKKNFILRNSKLLRDEVLEIVYKRIEG